MSISTLIVVYLVIGLFYTIGDFKIHLLLKEFSLIVALTVILTIGWLPLIIIRAIWGKK